MTRRPDPARSRAVLVGVSRYIHADRLPGIAAAATNLTDLQRLLTGHFSGTFASEHCTLVQEPRYSAQIGVAVRSAAGEATDVLLVYYAGHGLLDRRGRLHLALTESDPDQIGWTTLSFETLREEILESPANTRILILDCCFSGRAFEAMSDPIAAVAGQVDIKGTYTIVSSAANETSFAPAGHRNTAFTAALLASARGTPGLTLDELYRSTDRSLLTNGYPRPQRRSVDIAGDLVLFGRPDTEDRLRRAAAAGDVTAMFDLGYLLNERGELLQAETWFRRAADAGDRAAMFNLAYLLFEREEVTQAEAWFRRAADAGDMAAMLSLGLLLDDRHDATANYWFQRANDAGYTDSAFGIWSVFKTHSEPPQAEPW